MLEEEDGNGSASIDGWPVLITVVGQYSRADADAPVPVIIAAWL